jgi:dTMP kinase
MRQGRLIALEGIDGSGKTTQMAALATGLARLGHRVYRTCEPSDGPVGQFIRGAISQTGTLHEATLALLFAADRIEHLEREIIPHLQAGEIVLTDRYLLSSLAYQSTHLPIEWVAAINQQARKPDLSIVMSIGPEVAASRRQARGGKPEHFGAPKAPCRILHPSKSSRLSDNRTVAFS